MKQITTIFIALALSAMSSLALAEWKVGYDSFVNKWTVSDGKQTIRYNKEKSAQKAAEKLNKADATTEPKEE